MKQTRDTLSADRGNRFGIGFFRILLRCGGFGFAPIRETGQNDMFEKNRLTFDGERV